MSAKARKKVVEVIDHSVNQTGGHPITLKALGVLLDLEKELGDKITIPRACQALEELSKVALEIRDSLKE